MTFAFMLPLLLLLGQADGGAKSAALGEDNIYAAIPTAEREGFKMALSKLLESEKRGDWDDVYKLLDKETSFDGKTNISQAEFVEYVKKVRLVEFVNTGVFYIPSRRAWSVAGCATFYELPPFASQHKQGIVSYFYARRTSDGWRFSAPPSIRFDTDSGGTKGCTIKRP
jgi:hypothetical protein